MWSHSSYIFLVFPCIYKAVIVHLSPLVGFEPQKEMHVQNLGRNVSRCLPILQRRPYYFSVWFRSGQLAVAKRVVMCSSTLINKYFVLFLGLYNSISACKISLSMCKIIENEKNQPATEFLCSETMINYCYCFSTLLYSMSLEGSKGDIVHLTQLMRSHILTLIPGMVVQLYHRFRRIISEDDHTRPSWKPRISNTV